MAVTFGAEPGRVYTIVGRIASAGEQLSLAGVALRDALGWVGEPNQKERAQIPARAIAEVVSYFSIAAAQGVTNATARLLALDTRSRKILETREKSSRGFPPFDERDANWLPVNQKVIKSLEHAAVHHTRAVQDLVAELRTLVDSPEWSAMVETRNVDFHRWRPQSEAGGVSTNSPWVAIGESQFLPVTDRGTLTPKHYGHYVNQSQLALERLESTMSGWIAGFSTAKDEILTYVMAESMNGFQFDSRE